MLKALIVEDEIALQELYGRVLGNSGYDVTLAADGNFAIQLLEKNVAPQLILLDIRMPNRNGLEVLEFLKNYPGVENIHVVIATASRAYEEYAGILPSSEFLLKPIMPSHLQDIASRLQELLSS